MSTRKQNQTAQNRTSPSLPVLFHSYGLPPEFPIALHPHWTPSAGPIRHLHFHDCLEIGYCRAGRGIQLIGDEVLPYQKGDVCVIRRQELHFSSSDPNALADWTFVFLDPERLLGSFVEDFGVVNASLLGRPNLCPLVSGSAHPAISAAVQALADELNRGTLKTAAGRDAIRALATVVLLRLHRLRTGAVAKEAVSASLFQRLAPSLERIAAHWADPLRVPDLAELCGMGPRHFDRCFKLVTGKRPLEYLTQIRVAMACTDLISTDTRVITAALDNGFSSISNFNKSFRRVMGMAPAQWRAFRQGSAKPEETGLREPC